MSTIFFGLCGVVASVDCVLEGNAEAISAYLAPALLSFSTPLTSEAHVLVDHTGARVLYGPPVSSRPALTPLLQFEWVAVQWALAVRPGVALHAGCVLLRGRPILFVAQSGSGKSSMTLAAVRAGAEYLTDDLFTISGGRGYGLARAIRFKSIPASEEIRAPYLEGMDLESYVVNLRGEQRIVPLYAGEMKTVDCLDFSQLPPPVVVRVAQGAEPRLTQLSSLDRAIILHEAAITEHQEYDGSLGPGPTFDLVWRDPVESFQMLVGELERLGHLNA